MQRRTIADIYDKDIGFKKFASFIDLAKKDNIEIVNIKEYYEKYKFEVEGGEYEFSKQEQNSTKAYQFFKKTLDMRRTLVERGKLK